MKHMEEYRDAEISTSLADKIKRICSKEIRLMEVCGTHTMAIFRSGIRTLLPNAITLLSGPGCPVCVTDQKEIDAFIALARADNVILATFGDLIRVPGTESSLQQEHSAGRDIRVVYSVSDALALAKDNPDKKVAFPGVGFETTIPTVAATILAAQKQAIDNFFVFSAHKTVPQALKALMDNHKVKVDGFILPGHVSVVIGASAYLPFFDRYRTPCVIAGFEPADMLMAIYRLTQQIENQTPRLENAYPRAVTARGNEIAQQISERVFEPVDAVWRGLGMIPVSGLKIKPAFRAFDAEYQFDIKVSHVEEPKGCACGEILTGIKIPPACPLFKTRCTPANPVGPCMVSSEGTCAAYYRYYE
jgi:hydrogenase expression/formation protein HypD